MEADNTILLALACNLSMTCFLSRCNKIIVHLSYAFVPPNVFDPPYRFHAMI